jgi:signal transduction histidine kinase
VLEDPEYTLPVATTVGYRSALAVPMLREGIPVGTILVARDKVAPFSDQQITLLQTFAAQAVIAIENVRLFTELQEKNRALTDAHAQVSEALERQTATSEILRIIAGSPTELQPVLDAIAENAARVCDARDAVIYRIEQGDVTRIVAGYGPIPKRRVGEHGRNLVRGSIPGRAMLDRTTVHVHDIESKEGDDFPFSRDLQRRLGSDLRTALSTPLLREGVSIGAILIRRAEVQPFTDRQIETLETFARQAVIAIENVRLFTELQERNRALTQAHAQVTESLEQQTATAEILRVISRSPTDVRPAFEAIVQSASRLCDGADCIAVRFDGDLEHLMARHNPKPGTLDSVAALFPRRPRRDGTATDRAILERRIVHVADIMADSSYDQKATRAAQLRSILSVPLLRDDQVIGAISVSRDTPGLFSDRQVALLGVFADQAVIAIQNVRLFGELQERTQQLSRSVDQLTALAEVGRAVGSTLDLETVLTTIVSRAVQLSGLDGGVVFEYDEAAEEFVQRVATETAAALAEARRTMRIQKGEGVVGRTALTLEPVQVADITVPGAHGGRLRDILIDSGVRAVLAVPLVYEGRLIGSLGVTRNRPGEFPTETIELLLTFATQSALAIQNARLFEEIADKSRQLEAASRHKSEFLANMSHELRTPLNAVIGFSEVLLQRMFGDLNAKQDEYLKDIYASGQHLLSLINDILDLSKIEAGRMELELTDVHLATAIDNALILVRERAGRRGLRLGSTLDERLGTVRADERKVKQVLLNLLSNAIKFTPEGGRIEVRATPTNGGVEISVSDTGIGIAPEDQEAIFEEFQQVGTADKKIEGTGLGLALSRKFTELHGGRIWVTSQLGQGSTFTFTLPAST